MVNTKGGKGYKKGKGGGDTAPEFPEPGDGALFARVLKILGNCRIIAYCNDNERRICHIRGAMRKRVWINEGDVILVSTREFEKTGGAGAFTDPAAKSFENADVLAKYDPKHYARLKKDPAFNKQLLVELEKIDFDSNGVGHKIQALLAAAKDGDTVTIDHATGEAVVEETGYEWDRGDEEEHVEESEDETKPDYKKRHKIQDAKRNEARGNKESTAEIDIDAI
jgi:initiation factor 1A